jgi:hypothetical protein
MLARILGITLGCLLSLAAAADVTIQNFDAGGIGWAHGIVKMDRNGNRLIADDGGQIVQFAGDPLFYWYGNDGGLGSNFSFTTNLWNGFVVYTSTDLKSWTGAGAFDGIRMFDPATPGWRAMCNNGAHVASSTCWLPHPVFNSVLGKYVMFFTNSDGIFNVQCTSKVGGCSPTWHQTTNCGLAGHWTAYGNVFVDDDGTGYYIFTDFTEHSTRVQKLSTDFTDCVGSSVLVHTNAPNEEESAALFRRGSTYYAIFGLPVCSYCVSGVATYYATATSPLGTWSAATTFDSSNSCGGQHISTSKLVVAGNDVYLFTSFAWNPGNQVAPNNGAANQSMANEFWVPLTFTGTAINTFACSASFTLTGVTPEAAPAVVPGVDQTDESAAATSLCNVGGATQVAQTFTPSASGPLTRIWMPLYQGNNACLVGNCPSPAEQGVNADLTVKLTTVSSGAPATTLATMTVPKAGERWGARRHTLEVPGNVSVTAGTPYAIVLSSSGATNGCWGYLNSTANPYAGGAEIFSTNSGSSWSAAGSVDLIFSVGKDPGGVPGRRRL